MSTCENCGTNFELSSNPTEVTSLRILCPNCEAERRARKLQQKAAQGAAPVPAKAPVAKPSAVPAVHHNAQAATPVARPRPPATNDVTAARPAARASASPTPAAGPRRPASSAAPKPAPRLEPQAAPEPKRAERPTRTPERPARRREEAESEAASPAPRRGGAGRSRDVEREAVELKKRESRTVMIGWIAAGVMILAAGIAGVLALKRSRDQQNAIEARLNAQQAINEKARSFDIGTEAGAQQIVDYLNEPENLKLWAAADSRWNGDLVSLRAKAITNIQLLQEKRATQEAFDKASKELDNPANLTPDQIIAVRRTLGDIEADAVALGTEFVAQVSDYKGRADRALVERYLEVAREGSAQAKDTEAQRAALTLYTKAEEEITKLLDESFSKNRKEGQTLYTEKLQEVIKESDVLAAALFTPDYIEKTPWKDLLSGEQATFWNPSKAQGFAIKVDKGVLNVQGPDASAAVEGIVSIGDREKWRDFVLDMEINFESQGYTDLLFRLGFKPEGAPSLRFDVNPEIGDAYAPGESYELMFKAVGSQYWFGTADSIAEPEYHPEKLSWVKNRRGAIGFKVPGGMNFKVTRMRIKALR